MTTTSTYHPSCDNSIAVEETGLTVSFTTKFDGHVGFPLEGSSLDVEVARHKFVDLKWVSLHQVHSNKVAIYDERLQYASTEGDAIVGIPNDVAFAVFGADCAIIGLLSTEGIAGVVHAGWRGLVNGIIPNAVRTMREIGATNIFAVRGPCIHSECYEFSEDELLRVNSSLGYDVSGVTKKGSPALDLPKSIRYELTKEGVEVLAESNMCTFCSDFYFSYRRNGTNMRQGLVVYRS